MLSQTVNKIKICPFDFSQFNVQTLYKNSIQKLFAMSVYIEHTLKSLRFLREAAKKVLFFSGPATKAPLELSGKRNFFFSLSLKIAGNEF